MDSAEQAALSESERDSARAQSQTSTFRHHYDHRHMNDYLADDAKDSPPRPMRRFENLIVNLTHSSILTPTGVDINGTLHFFIFPSNSIFFSIFPSNISIFHFNDTIYFSTEPEVRSSIAWSQHLDPIFANNLERDAALSWQYFGSSTGFLRRFPGTQWPHAGATDNKPINDFRIEDWFIQAASSPKDIVSESKIHSN